jgi:ATP-binding cassette subfamily B protein
MKKGLSNFGFFIHFAQPDRTRFSLAILLMVCSLVFDLSMPFILKYALLDIGDGQLDSMRWHSLLFLGLLVAEYLCLSLFTYLLSTALLNTIHRIRTTVFAHVLDMKMAFFDHAPVGKLLTRVVNDAESLAETLRSGIATLFVDFFTVLGVLWVMLKLELRLAPIILVALPLVVLVVRFSGIKLKKNYLKIRKKLAASNALMAEGISGVEVLQSFHSEENYFGGFKKTNREYRQATIWNNVYDISLYAFIDTVAAIVAAGVLFWAFHLEFGWIEVSSVIVFLSLIERIFIPVRDLSNKFTTLQQAMAAMDRIFSLLRDDQRIRQGGYKGEQGFQHIEFRSVSFSYGKDTKSVVSDISFEVKPGCVLALVGRTGSGKSTIGKLLTRSYEPYDGEIVLGGVEARSWNYCKLREKIAVVHQDIDVFPGTLRDNITLFCNDISDERILNAVKLVQAERFLESLNGGLDFMVRENGENLSSGQLQLIVFARALARETPVILMDEATSSVDSVTEAWIQDAISAVLKCKTVIIVAHRLSTIAHADEILVLDEGRIIQRGTYEDLRSREGLFATFLAALDE